jgi:hypothetical protein
MLLHCKEVMEAKPEVLAKWRELGKELMVK